MREEHTNPGLPSKVAHPSALVPGVSWAWVVISSVLGLGVLILAGMIALLVHEYRKDQEARPPADLALLKPAPQANRAGSSESNLQRTALAHETNPPAARALSTPDERRDAAIPAPVVSRTTPAEARLGQPFTLFLTCNTRTKAPVTYQFRMRPADRWQVAPQGRVELARLGPGPLHLEFRIVDSRGRASPVGSHTWTPSAKQPPVLHVGRWHVGDRLYLEVVFERRSTGQALSIDFQDHARFALLSSFHVDRATAEGLELTQKVEAARLAQSPAALATGLDSLLRKTQGQTFRLTLGPEGVVTRFEGTPQALKLQQLGTDSSAFFLQTALDADSWKELANLTFFQPRSPTPGAGWSRKLEHHWGSLGRWTGQIIYQPAGHVRKFDRYAYRLDLAYHAPAKGDTSLPFQLDGAAFRVLKGAGAVVYDPAHDQVSQAEEQFHVRGSLTVNALGVTAPLEMEELQTFQLRILDHIPDAWRKPAQAR